MWALLEHFDDFVRHGEGYTLTQRPSNIGEAANILLAAPHGLKEIGECFRDRSCNL